MVTTIGKLDQVWLSLSTADRHSILGHERSVLTSEDRALLARVITRERYARIER